MMFPEEQQRLNANTSTDFSKQDNSNLPVADKLKAFMDTLTEDERKVVWSVFYKQQVKD